MKSKNSEKLAWLAVGFLASRYVYTPIKRAFIIATIIGVGALGWYIGHYDIDLSITYLTK